MRVSSRGHIKLRSKTFVVDVATATTGTMSFGLRRARRKPWHWHLTFVDGIRCLYDYRGYVWHWKRQKPFGDNRPPGAIDFPPPPNTPVGTRHV